MGAQGEQLLDDCDAVPRRLRLSFSLVDGSGLPGAGNLMVFLGP